MSDEQKALAPITFTFAYAGHGWGRAEISDGDISYLMEPAYTPTDPLYELVRALVELLAYGGQRACDWYYEPPVDRWVLARDGDVLTITIRGVERWPHQRGGMRFSAKCDLWAFAVHVRSAVDHIEAPEQPDYYDPCAVQKTTWFRDLCAHLDAHTAR